MGLLAQNRNLRCMVALPAFLSRVNVVEPDLSTSRCGVRSIVVKGHLPSVRNLTPQ